MFSGKKSVLFVSHDTSISGAPILLLSFLKWLKANTNISFTILIKEPDKLLPKFKALADTYVWQQKLGYEKGTVTHTASRIRRKFTGKTINKPFPKKLKESKFDLIYLNTVASLDLGPILKSIFNCPVIAHIHEGRYTLQELYKGFNTASTRAAIDHYITVSKHTANIVMKEFEVLSSDVSVAYGFTNTNMDHLQNNETGFEDFYKNAFVVGAVGQAIWRKGVDLFVNTAAYIKDSYPDARIKFVWVGDTDIDDTFEGKMQYELQQYGLNNTVIFTGLSNNTPAFFKRFDVLVLPSREDPFPLVCLEAAAFATPLICFNNAGGMPEFVQAGNTGEVVEYGNTHQLADSILGLYNDKTLQKTYGANAKTHAMNFSAEKGSEKLWNMIQLFMDAH